MSGLVLLGIACLIASPFFWNSAKKTQGTLGGFGPSMTIRWGRVVTTVLIVAGIVLILAGK
jgi:hypothetical protein